MNQEKVIENTLNYVKETLAKQEGSHDFWHVYRVWKNSKLIGKNESVDILEVELTALLHDIRDYKHNGGDEKVGPELASNFLKTQNLPEELIKRIKSNIESMGFKESLGDQTIHSKEQEVVMDADKLDAIGAIGVARCLTYSGYKGIPIYIPGIEPRKNITKEKYKKNPSQTAIIHFYEKLLKLKDMMRTETGGEIAEQRHKFMVSFLEEFLEEFYGKK